MTATPLEAVFSRLRVEAQVFFTGALCGVANFQSETGPGHLHLLRRGHLRITDAQDQIRIIPGPAALLFPRPTRHRLDSNTDGDTSAAAELVCAELLLGGAANPFYWALPDLLWLSLDRPDDLLAPVLELLFQEAVHNNPGRQPVMNRLAEVALIHLLRAAITQTTPQIGLLAGLAHPHLSKALALIHADPGAELTLEVLADAAGLSRSALAETFRRVVGQSPGQYLSGWRLSLARDAIAQGRPVKAVARDVGYQSPAALSRAFARHFGTDARSLKKTIIPPKPSLGD